MFLSPHSQRSREARAGSRTTGRLRRASWHAGSQRASWARPAAHRPAPLLWHPPLHCLLRARPALRNPRVQTFPLLGEDRDQDGYECRDNRTEKGDDDLPLELALLAQVPLDLLDTVLVGLFQVVDTLADVVQLLGHRAHEAADLGVCDTLSET